MDTQHYHNLLNYISNSIFPLDFSEAQKKQLVNQSKHYLVKNNLLFKKDRNNQHNLVKVVQKYEMDPVLYMCHNDLTAAHASKDRMMDKMKKRFFWPQMFQDISTYVESCDACQRREKLK